MVWFWFIFWSFGFDSSCYKFWEHATTTQRIVIGAWTALVPNTCYCKSCGKLNTYNATTPNKNTAASQQERLPFQKYQESSKEPNCMNPKKEWTTHKLALVCNCVTNLHKTLSRWGSAANPLQRVPKNSTHTITHNASAIIYHLSIWPDALRI